METGFDHPPQDSTKAIEKRKQEKRIVASITNMHHEINNHMSEHELNVLTSATLLGCNAEVSSTVLHRGVPCAGVIAHASVAPRGTVGGINNFKLEHLTFDSHMTKQVVSLWHESQKSSGSFFPQERKNQPRKNSSMGMEVFQNSGKRLKLAAQNTRLLFKDRACKKSIRLFSIIARHVD